MSERIYYHGTDKEAAQEILKTGFRAGTFFAENLADAIGYGGSWVFSVAISLVEEDSGRWQFTLYNALPPEKIVRLNYYRKRTVYEK